MKIKQAYLFNYTVRVSSIINYSILLMGILLLLSVPAKAQIPNPSFENWESTDFGDTKINEPSNWISSNLESYFTAGKEAAKKSTDAKTGSSSLRLENYVDTMQSINKASRVYTGIINYTTGEENFKFPVSGRPIHLKGNYKCTITGIDTVYAGISVYKNGKEIGWGTFMQMRSILTYNVFTVKITYPDSTIVPDSASILIRSGSATSPAANTVFIVDDLSLTMAPKVSVTESAQLNTAISIYPNPFSQTLHIANGSKQNQLVWVYTLDGKQVAKTTLMPNEKQAIYLQEQGLYIVKVTGADGESVYQKVYNIN
jgi:hypothetical protein